MATYRLTLEYDGRGFEGWQVQPGDHRTVQGVLEAALARVTGEAVRVHAAGRTDTGVHARAQIAAVALEAPREAAALQHALNGVLPPDVVVRECAPAAEGFQPRHAARGKLYRYCVWNGAVASPLRRDRWYWVRAPLDVAAMRTAANSLLGEHDFAAFHAAGADGQSSVRRIDGLTIRGETGGELVFDVEGPGFLRHMVRIVVGTLLEVGRGRRRADELPEILAGRDRTRAGPTAPAAALTLVRVDYAEASPAGSAPRSGRKST